MLVLPYCIENGKTSAYPNWVHEVLTSLKGLRQYSRDLFRGFPSALDNSLIVISNSGEPDAWKTRSRISRELVSLKGNLFDMTVKLSLYTYKGKPFPHPFKILKGTQAWDILGLRFWILYFFVVTYCAAKALFSCPAIISQRLESRIISNEPRENTEEDSKII